MNVAIIPARGGSKRIPRKNIRPFHGKPMLAYSIAAAQESGLFDSMFVSTDDEDTMRIAVEMGCFIHLRSTAHLCGDEAGTQEVARDCLLNSTSGQHDYACCIYATAPMLTADDLRYGYERRGGYTYTYVPGWYYWGTVNAFIDRPEIEKSCGLIVAIEKSRYIDINTEDDWNRAEQMYAAMHA